MADRFSRAGGTDAGYVGSKKVQAQVAQSVEHTLGKGEVSGSNPLLGSS